MLLSSKNALQFSLAAKDGAVGEVYDFYIEDSTWTIRYLVANTGSWLIRKKVLLSPLSIVKDVDLHNLSFKLDLTKAQIEEAPPADLIKTISEQYERRFFKHYKMKPYWEGANLWGDSDLLKDIQGVTVDLHEGKKKRKSTLRSAKEITGYHIQAEDGEIGHIDDFIYEEETWKIRYVIVDTRNWLPDNLVTISPDWITSVDWLNKKVIVDVNKNAIKDAPQFDSSKPINRSYETKVYDYFGRPVYWKGSMHKSTDGRTIDTLGKG